MNIGRKVWIAAVGLTFIAVLGLLAGCGQAGKKPIIRVGDWTMDVDLFRETLMGEYGTADVNKLTESQVNKKIKDIIAQRLVTVEAHKLSLDTLDYAKTTYQNALNKEAMGKLQKEVVVNQLITEKKIRDYYNNDKYEVRAFHILIKDGKQRSNEQAKQLADSLYEVAIQPGTNFIELAKKYNEDPTTPAGDIGWFGWGTMVPEFQNQVWSMDVNDISEPIHTTYGWHIIRLANRRERKNREPYVLDRERIRQKLTKYYGKELLDLSLAFVDSLKKVYGVEIHRKAVDEMLLKIKTTGDPIRSADPFKRFTDADKAPVVVTFDLPPGSLRVGDISNYMVKFVAPEDRFLNKNTVDRQLDIIVSQLYLMPEEMKKRGILKDPDVLHAAQEAEDYYLFYYLKNQRADKIPQPTVDEMKAYYQKHIDKFHQPKRYKGIELLVDDAARARKFYRQIKNGASIEKLAEKYTVRANGKMNKGHLGPFKAGSFGPLSDALANAKEGDLVGPVDLHDGYSIFLLQKIYPPGPAPFEVVRDKVFTMLHSERADSDYAAWTDSLMTNSPYKVYRNNLKYVFENKD